MGPRECRGGAAKLGVTLEAYSEYGPVLEKFKAEFGPPRPAHVSAATPLLLLLHCVPCTQCLESHSERLQGEGPWPLVGLPA